MGFWGTGPLENDTARDWLGKSDGFPCEDEISIAMHNPSWPVARAAVATFVTLCEYGKWPMDEYGFVFEQAIETMERVLNELESARKRDDVFVVAVTHEWEALILQAAHRARRERRMEAVPLFPGAESPMQGMGAPLVG